MPQFALLLGLLSPAFAHATLTVQPLTWNIVGLDSNSPATGPKYFPVGARVCSTGATTNVAVAFVWDSLNPNVNLRTGTADNLVIGSIGAGLCSDVYFEAEVNQVVGAFDTARRYHITATDGTGTASSPTPRELYVEHLISQNRNSVTGVKLNGSSIPPGGSMNLMVGNTYTIELDGGTATQGYNQFEAFINFPNTIFQVLSVSTTYSADSNTTNVPNPNSKLYADACIWENNPTSPNYRSCVGGDDKAGGATVVTTYSVKILSGGGTSQTLNTLLYDFSGSSFHYNSDFSAGARIANIVDPASSLSFSKSFSPGTTTPGGTSTLSFTISNSSSSQISGLAFSDTFPTSPASMTVASPATYSTSGCGTPTFTPTAAAGSISFSNGVVAPNSNCIITVAVTVPSAGTYNNTSGALSVGGNSTGKTASASLTAAAATAGTGICGPGTLAHWTVPNGTTANPPDLTGGIPTTLASNVPSAVAFANVPGDSAILSGTGNGQNDLTSWRTFGYKLAGQFIEFDVDTRNYTGVSMSYYVANPGGGNGPSSLVLAYDKGEGAGFQTAQTISNPASGFTLHTFDFTGLTSTTGLTKFKLTATGANQDTTQGELDYDNISFTGTSCGAAIQPTLTKAFATNPIAVNGTSTLTFTLTNTNTVQLTGAKFSDALPAGLEVAAAPNASTTCGNSPTWAPVAGATTLAFGQTTGATIPASGSCTVSVSVKATTSGPHTNVSGFISTTEGGTNSTSTGSATATLTALVAPSVYKVFGTNPILVNGSSLLTVTITNPNPNDTLSGIAFSDTYPTSPGAMVNQGSLVSNTCGGSAIAANGANTISLSGGSLAGGASCTLSVNVTAPAAGSYANTSGAVSATIPGSGNTATDTLVVNAPHPAISLLKQIGTTATGPWYTFLSVPPATSLYYRFTIENIGDVALSPVSVNDPTVSAAGCSWPGTLPVASPIQDPTATCVVGAISAQSGDNPNTATASGTYSGTPYASVPSSADYIGAVAGFSLLKQASTTQSGPWSSSISVAPGGNVYYKFTLVNTGGVQLSSISVTDPLVSTASCTFTDPLPINGATSCVVGAVTASSNPGDVVTNTATGHGNNGGTPVDTATSSATYTVSSNSADLMIAKTDGVTSVNAGGSLTYTITVTNNGPGEVTGATVADTAPAGLTIGNWTCAVTNAGSGGSVTTACGAASGSGDINTTVDMKNGAVITYTVPATVAGGATGSIANTATVTVPGGVADPTPGNNSATDTDTVTPVADLAITKSDGATSVNAGGSTTYTITVVNNGPSEVAAATVTDTAPAGLAIGNWTCAVTSTGSGGSVTTACGAASGSGNISTTVDMKSGAIITYTVPATIAGGASGTIANTATVAVPAGTTDPTPGNNSATDSDTVNLIADLAITKTDGAASVNAGGSTTYTITVTNNGPSEVSGAVITDTAPAGMTIGNWTCAVTNAGSGGSVTTACGATSGSGNISTTADLKNGAIITYTVPATIAGNASGTIANTSTVAAPAGVTDPTPGNNSATDSDTVSLIADLAISKTDGATSVNAGGSTTYTITVTNNGPSEVSGATVVDTAPAGMTIGNWTCAVTNAGSGGSATTACGAASGSGNINTTADLKNGAIVTYTVPVTIAGGATGSLSNTATVAAPGGVTDPTPGNNSATDTDTVTPVADLAITKTDGATSVNAGGSTTYTITVTNNGPSEVSGAAVADTAPAGLTIGNWTCAVTNAGSGGSVTTACGAASGSGNINTTVNMKNGAVITYTVPASIAGGATGTIANTATVAVPGGTTDPTPGNNSATDSNTVTPVADLSITKTDGVTSVNAGGSTTYTIVVTNNGPSEVTGASVTDTAPAGLTLGNWTCAVTNAGSGGSVTTACGAASGSGNINTTVTMKNGAIITYTVPATIAGGATGTIANTATVAVPGGTTDPTPGNNSATDTDTVGAVADLAITKTDSVSAVNAGGATTYTITVTNNGPSEVTGATVADTAPAGLTIGNWTCAVTNAGSGGSVTTACGAASGSGNINTTVNMKNGAIITYTVPATIAGSATGTIANTATVTAPGGVTDPTPGNNSATDSDTVTPVADLALTKTDGVTVVSAGGATTYTVTVTNNGPSAVTGAALVDTAPAGLTIGNWTCAVTNAGSGGSVTTACGAASGSGNVNTTVNLKSGAVVTYTIAATVAAGASGTIANTATVTVPAGTTDPVPGNNSATDSDSVAAPNGTISGHVWYDLNHNHRRDAGEYGRAGWTVELLSGPTVIATTTSDAQGAYSFGNLAVGAYSVRFINPNGASLTSGPTPVSGENGNTVPGGASGASISQLSGITLTADQSGNVSAVPEQSLPIDPSGVVYNSVARTPIAGATVTLLLNGSPISGAYVVGGSASVTTAADGSYAFFLLPSAPGSVTDVYSLSVAMAGYTFPSVVIPASPANGFTGGAVTPVSGAPTGNQATTYYLSFAKPLTDITNDNIPLDPPLLAPQVIPTLGESALTALSVLLGLMSMFALRRRTRR